MADDTAARVSETPAKETVDEKTTTEVNASEPASVDASAQEDKPTNGAAENGKDSADAAVAANGDTPASAKKNQKRKSTGGVPEHKNKKLNRKKSMATLHLDVQPGQYWFVHMKGYPPWPAVICDEEMLPTSLLSSRPVSAKGADGTYRADFEEGGKHAKDRRYPVMFMGTNEFAWHVNTDLNELDVEAIKDEVKGGERGKKSKQLWDAYNVAAQEHNLDHFKQMLIDHENSKREEEEAFAAKEAEKANKKAEKSATKTKRKSTSAKEVAADEDVEMADADDAVKAPKSASKKRKKDAEADADAAKSAKTPKKLKVNLKEPAEDASSKKKTPKEKKEKKAAKPKAEKSSAEPELTEEQKRDKMQKMVLYLRHKLQKGFLARDQKPQEEEMDSMDAQFKQLEQLDNLDAQVIRETKINKVLKAILKLGEIPKEPEYNFKERANALLNKMAPILGLESEPALAKAEASSTAPVTNGVKHDEEGEKAKDTAAKHEGDDEKQSSEAPAAEEKKIDEKPAPEATAAAA